MILVTVGTLEYPFPRLLRACRSLEALGEDIVVQCGECGIRPFRANYVDYLPPDELRSLAGEARAVVTHAGIGSVATALEAGIKPIVMPRRKRLHEHIDDHQVTFAARLAALGLAVQLEDLPDLVLHIRKTADRIEPPLRSSRVVGAVSEAIRRHAGAPLGVGEGRITAPAPAAGGWPAVPLRNSLET